MKIKSAICFFGVLFLLFAAIGCEKGSGLSSSDTLESDATETAGEGTSEEGEEASAVADEIFSLSAGNCHVCALTTAGKLFCWGCNSAGALGSGASSSSLTEPVPVEEATLSEDWSSVAAGAAVTCALKNDGSRWCWGNNSIGLLGIGLTPAYLDIPEQSDTRTDWTAIDAGHSHICALTAAHTLYCWGDNFYGQLGIGDVNTGSGGYVLTEPTQELTKSNDWKSVSAGSDKATCAIKTDGSLWCWGKNNRGQLGDGTTTTRYAPTRVGNATNWQTASVGSSHTCALTTAGALWCWGGNWAGQLGDGSTTIRKTPKLINANGSWVQIAAGHDSTCGIKNDGSLWCWGKNDYGQLGDGSTEKRLEPTRVGTLSDWTQVKLGGADYACALRGEGTAFCWGLNYNRQLGDGTTETRYVPTPVDF